MKQNGWGPTMIKLILAVRVAVALLTLDLDERIATEYHNNYGQLSDQTYNRAEKAAARAGVETGEYILRSVALVDSLSNAAMNRE